MITAMNASNAEPPAADQASPPPCVKFGRQAEKSQINDAAALYSTLALKRV